MLPGGIFVLLSLSSGWAFMDPCTFYPKGFLPANETEVVVPSPTCLQGVIDWNYPRGTVELRYNQLKAFQLCINNWIGGDAFTIYDDSFGHMTQLKTLSDEPYCIRSNGKHAKLFIKAPPEQLYMGGFNFVIKE